MSACCRHCHDAGSCRHEVPVSQPGDRHEREADAAAHGVLQGATRPSLSPLSTPTLARRGHGGPARLPLDRVRPAGAGQALDAPLKAAMQRRFGHDFGAVRVHTDTPSQGQARRLGARAYTLGNDIVFDGGQYAPRSARGQQLLAHELAHVVQQRGQRALVQREMFYGGGYKQRAYGSLDEEIASGRKKPSEWHPATPDMAATAAGSGGGEAVSTLDELLKKIESKGKGSITRLNLIGHSNSSVFSFGGTITKDNVEFFPSAALYDEALTNNADRIAALRDRFAAGATIVLYSCDAGSGQALLDAVGKAFGVCTQGFTSEIWWCLSKTDRNQAVRGRVWAQNPNDPLPSDAPSDCAAFAADVTTLVAGGKSAQCSAARKAAP